MSRIQKTHIVSIVLVLTFIVLTCTGCVNTQHYQLRKTLDKYESLVDKYYDFVEKYGTNPEYGTYPESEFMELMSEWSEVNADVEKINIDKLSDDDLLYFFEVIGRVTYKLDAIESGNLQTK